MSVTEHITPADQPQSALEAARAPAPSPPEHASMSDQGSIQPTEPRLPNVIKPAPTMAAANDAKIGHDAKALEIEQHLAKFISASKQLAGLKLDVVVANSNAVTGGAGHHDMAVILSGGTVNADTLHTILKHHPALADMKHCEAVLGLHNGQPALIMKYLALNESQVDVLRKYVTAAPAQVVKDNADGTVKPTPPKGETPAPSPDQVAEAPAVAATATANDASAQAPAASETPGAAAAAPAANDASAQAPVAAVEAAKPEVAAAPDTAVSAVVADPSRLAANAEVMVKQA